MSSVKKFQAGVPACPIACKYCFITEHDVRRETWNQYPLIGVNKSCTYINWTPWFDAEEKKRILTFDWSLLQSDIVGSTAITDAFWPKLREAYEIWLDKASQYARLLTTVTKWPLNKHQFNLIQKYQDLKLVIAITGNDNLEKVKSEAHLKTLEKCLEKNINALPIIHPYISGISNISFLRALKKIGYKKISIKGLRYCDNNMKAWMNKESVKYYADNEHKEILPEDGWRNKINDAGLELISPMEWYLSFLRNKKATTTKEMAKKNIDNILNYSNITTSATFRDLYDSMLNRRIIGINCQSPAYS